MDARRSRGIYNAYLQMTRQAIFQGRNSSSGRSRRCRSTSKRIRKLRT